MLGYIFPQLPYVSIFAVDYHNYVIDITLELGGVVPKGDDSYNYSRHTP
jgi:hypothetical protein